MIVFDGDSVIATLDSGFPIETRWAHLVASSRNRKYVNIGKPESTAAKCFMRIWMAMSYKPSWYVLQLGQWAMNHEPIDQFEIYLRKIIEIVNISDCKVCLVTHPPVMNKQRFYALPYIETIVRLSKIYKTELLNLHQYMSLNESNDLLFIPDGMFCHFNIEGNAYVASLFNLDENVHICK